MQPQQGPHENCRLSEKGGCVVGFGEGADESEVPNPRP